MGLVGPVGNEAMQVCIDECKKCLQACEECLTLCLNEPDVSKMVGCIKELRDCIDICDIAIKFMSRNSDYAKDICKLCAKICTSCAQTCESMQIDHCKKWLKYIQKEFTIITLRSYEGFLFEFLITN